MKKNHAVVCVTMVFLSLSTLLSQTADTSVATAINEVFAPSNKILSRTTCCRNLAYIVSALPQIADQNEYPI